MEGLSIEGNSLAADIQNLIQRMERIRIEGNSLAADMPESIQEAHSENKNEQVAEPELDSVIEYGTGAEFMSMEEIFGVAYFDRAYLKEMPCYDNVVLIDVDQD
ncbi:hypothetical protein P8452_45343 [Trifolium repens]|nr:hypothetical protein P8452_45343 [Trifolium repens]